MSRRCEEHGLATGHDGKCVICRRSNRAPPSDESPHRRSAVATSAALAALVGAGALVWGALAVPIAPAMPAAAILDEEPQPVAASPEAKRRAAKPTAPEDHPDRSITPATRDRAHEPARAAEEDRRDDEPARVVDDHEHADGASRSRRVIATEQGAQAARQQAARPDDGKARAREQAERAQQERQALARARKKVSIEMYSTQTCGYCTAARRYLDGKGYSYREHDIDSDSQAERRLRALNPRGGVPTFDIDGKAVAGFNPEHLEWVIDYQGKKRLDRF